MIVDLNELEEGLNDFEWEETPEALYIQDEALRFAGPIRTRMAFMKLGESISASGSSHATLQAECVRCLEPVRVRLESSFKFIFQKGSPGSAEDESDETLIWLGETGDKVDLGEEVKDYILLEVPQSPLCKESCAGLCPVCGENLNDRQCDCTQETFDPRWEALRALKDKM